MTNAAHLLIRPRTEGLLSYCAAVACLAVAGTLAIWYGVALVGSALGEPVDGAPGWLVYPDPYMRLLFASILETAAITSLAHVLQRFVTSPIICCALLATAWAGLSSALFGFSHFLSSAWVYLLLTATYYAWQARSSWHGFGSVAIVAVAVNSISFGLEALLGGA